MTKKYEFTGKTQIVGKTTLHQIRRISDGLVGGWIESEKNLSQNGECFVYDNAWVSGDAKVYGNAKVYDDASVYGDALVTGNAKVYGDATVSDNATVSGDASVYDDAKVSGNARVSGNAKVFGKAKVYGNAWVYGNATVSGDALVFDDALVSGNAKVSGDDESTETPKTEVKANIYAIVSRAVEEGVVCGYARAHKHTDVPGEHHIKDQIELAVMNALCEVLDFDR